MTTLPAVSGVFAPTHAAFAYTDHSGVTVDASMARFLRPGVTVDDHQYIMPGARVRFRSNAPEVTIRMGFNGLIETEYVDDVSVLVEGEAHDYASTSYPADFSKTLEFDRPDFRTFELILPFGGSLDFFGVTQDPAFGLWPCLPRPTGKILFVGDSITQGASATKAPLTFPYLTAEALGLQCINMGFSGARLTHHGSASYSADIDPDIVVVLMGLNNYSDQMGESTFKSQYTTLINGLLSNTSADIYACTPIYTTAPGATPISSYRTWIGQAVAAIGSGRVTLVDGLTLATNSTTNIPDGKHPNDAGNAEIAAALTALLS